MRLFKYRGGEEEIFKRDLVAIEKNFFWASNFNQLNDPCETLISSDKFKSLTKTVVRFTNKNVQQHLEKVHEALDNVLSSGKKIGIYSLSETYNDELLWAHYANSHKGYCIEYDLELLLETYPTAPVYSFPVKYSKHPPEVGLNDLSDKDSIIKKLGAYKSERWKYEKEYRIITYEGGEHAYNFQAVKAIYFGLRMPEPWKKEIMNRLKGRGIEYYQINQIQGKYLFEREQVTDINGNEITYLCQIPKSSTRESAINYRIGEKDFNKFTGKATINIELETQLTKDELNWIAYTIKKNLFVKAKRIFMMYTVKGQLDNDMAWATTNFDEDQVSIFINEHVKFR